MASIMAAATSRVLAAKTPFLGQGRAAANASPLRDVAANATGRITMVRRSHSTLWCQSHFIASTP